MESWPQHCTPELGWGRMHGERFKRMSVRAGRPNGALICGAVILGLLLSGCTQRCRTSGDDEPVDRGRQSQRTVLTCHIRNVQSCRVSVAQR